MAEPPKPPTAGAVLVGGSSRRMGRDKALIQVGGVAMVNHIGGVLAAVGLEPVLAIGPSLLTGGLDHCEDLYPGQGPLGGVLTALSSMIDRASAVCVVACDMPMLDTHSIIRLLDATRDVQADVVMAQTDRVEPLCAIWNASSLPILQQAFDNGERAIHRVLPALSVIAVQLPGAALRNVNTPDDLPGR